MRVKWRFAFPVDFSPFAGFGGFVGFDLARRFSGRFCICQLLVEGLCVRWLDPRRIPEAKMQRWKALRDAVVGRSAPNLMTQLRRGFAIGPHESKRARYYEGKGECDSPSNGELHGVHVFQCRVLTFFFSNGRLIPHVSCRHTCSNILCSHFEQIPDFVMANVVTFVFEASHCHSCFLDQSQ